MSVLDELGYHKAEHNKPGIFRTWRGYCKTLGWLALLWVLVLSGIYLLTLAYRLLQSTP